VKRQVKVDVAGQTFTLKTDADEDYVRSLAKYVDKKIAETKGTARTVATQSLVILAALQLADELFQSRQRDQDFRKTVRTRSQRLLELRCVPFAAGVVDHAPQEPLVLAAAPDPLALDPLLVPPLQQRGAVLLQRLLPRGAFLSAGQPVQLENVHLRAGQGQARDARGRAAATAGRHRPLLGMQGARGRPVVPDFRHEETSPRPEH
jgi:cell division protein ZapA